MFSKFKKSNAYTPLLNVGCLMDISSGRYERGMRGENILNGGVAAIEGYTGRGNSFKSTLMDFRTLRVLQRMKEAGGYKYDTEVSATLVRLQDLGRVLDPTGELSASIDDSEERFLFTSARDYTGSAWWNEWRNVIQDRIKNGKLIETPFKGRDGNPIKMLPPLVGGIDSYSSFQTDVVFEKLDKGTIGDGDLNSVAMQNANGKNQLMDSLPYFTGRGGFTMMLSAHMGNQIIMDKYSTPKKQLANLSNTSKMKKVPEAITFLTNNLFEMVDPKPLLGSDKLPEFPRDGDDDMKGAVDLMEVTVLPLRTKYGPTGFPFTLVVSQRFGIQPELSEYLHIKKFGRFGLTGNLVQQKLAIYPEVTFTRKSIRSIVKSDPKFCRALEFLSELCQINTLWPEYAAQYMVEPTELYEGLKAKGYDWDVLLQTRGYWTFDQYTHPVPFLSTKDLLEMYHGTYHPYWMKPLENKA